MKPSLKILALTSVVAMSASGVTNYIIPWYVNPTFKSQVYLGDDAAEVTSLNVDPAGRYLSVGAVANGDFANIQAYKLDDLKSVTGVMTNGFTGRVSSGAAGIGNAPIVAVNSTVGAVVGVNGDLSKAVRMKCGANRWINGLSPVPTFFTGAEDSVSSFVFNTAGTSAWANSATAGRTGLVVEWGISNGSFVKTREIQTGLSSVGALGVYTVRGKEYVFAAEGNASGATAGMVKMIDAATGAVTTFINDAAHLGAGVVSIKMSHTDYFRPRLYALLSNGDIACYYWRHEISPLDVRWSKTITNAELLTAAKAAWTADHAKVCAFEVFPDGATSVIAYRRNAGDETPASGAVRLAMLNHTTRAWRAYDKDEEGNPRKGVAATLTDGVWNLNYTLIGSEIYVGVENQTGSAWTSDNIQEYLDFNVWTVEKGNSNLSIAGHYKFSLCTNSVSGGRAPRVLVHSMQLNSFNQSFKNIAGDAVFEEIAFETSKTPWVGGWSSPPNETKRFVPRFKELGSFGGDSFLQGGWGSESKFDDLYFGNIGTVRTKAFSGVQASGTMNLQMAHTVQVHSFYNCINLSEVVLGTWGWTTFQIENQAFYGCTSLKRIRFLNGHTANFQGANAFYNCPLEEVVLTAGLITKEASVATVWPDTKARQIVFAVPRGNAEWEAVINDPSKVKYRLTPQEQADYLSAHPGNCIPFGVLDKDVVFAKNDQLIAYNDMRGGVALTIEKDEFFNDAVEVTSDLPASPDGKYVPGTTITLTARPDAASDGVFRKWYGDVPKDQAGNACVSFVLNENRWVYCRMVHPWTLAADKRTASNGNFTINCAVRSSVNHTLDLGKSDSSDAEEKGGASLYADDDAGQGVCDLGGEVRFEGDATPWKFGHIPWSQGAFSGTRLGKGNADVLITPGTITSWTYGQFMNSKDPDRRSLKVFIFDEPQYAGSWDSWAMAGQADLTRMILQMPCLKAFTGEGSIGGSSFSETDLGWWDLSGLTSLYGGAFYGLSWDNRVGSYGILELPALRSLNADTRKPFQNMKNVEGFVIGGKTRADTVTNICINAFYGDTNLRKVTIYNSADMAVDSTPFNQCAALNEIWLQGAAMTGASFANLLGSVTAAEVKPVKVYVSSLMHSWLKTDYLDYSPTDAERAQAPGERVIAVYRGGAAAPSGKALIIHRDGPYDPKGTCILIR